MTEMKDKKAGVNRSRNVHGYSKCIKTFVAKYDHKYDTDAFTGG